MKYTHLFFDLDNTLWDFNANSYDALYLALKKMDLLEKIGAYDSYFSIYHKVNERLWDLYKDNKITKNVLRGLRFEESLELNNTPMPGIGDALNGVYLEEMPKQLKLVPGALVVLDFLHHRYRMSIITNGFREVQGDKLLQSGLKKYFDKVFISEEVGAQKPHRKIFEHAVKSMNAPKKKSLMIGDSWDADIIGARQFGMDQVYYCPDPEKLSPARDESNNSTGTSTTIITHLEQLLEML
ncbi:MAG TPA: YjjG family noncanonical pyrimidine nucleotidase [Prolixibacteraceae bacterium]|nr:YjjG family noncanonical pyrimidine nucleotidase [Prolixibacteraceae bacterium]